ncbi:MAG TPA: protocatechuate 3,4-dioxygenase [Rhodothermales bacterium]|nr:protocatechuate 3,4-dioxygenase [Rhodothermales bacterium]
MPKPKKMNRRAVLQAGFGAGAALVGGGLIVASSDGSECATPQQTEGPFYPKQNQLDKDIDLTIIEGRGERADGDVIQVGGQVLDQDLKPVAGALVEIWQANKHGRYHHEDDSNPAPRDPNFQGWGQVKTDDDGRYGFRTIIPGAYPASGEWLRPPHIHFKVAKRGYHELITQMYFAGHELNAKDFILQELSEDEQARVVVSLAEPSENDPDARLARFNIMLRRVSTG